MCIDVKGGPLPLQHQALLVIVSYASRLRLIISVRMRIVRRDLKRDIKTSFLASQQER